MGVREMAAPAGSGNESDTMTEKNLELTRRKVLGGLTAIGAASAGAGAGTMALFSDTEQSTGNTVQAGTLDLNADGGDSEVTTVTVSNAVPGDSGSDTTTLNNNGTMAGSVDLVFSGATNDEGDNPESETETTTPGDLGDVLEVTVSVGSTQVDTGTFNTVFDGTEADANVSLASGTQKDLTIDWTLPSGAGNDIQGDSVSGDITVQLNQKDSQ